MLTLAYAELIQGSHSYGSRLVTPWMVGYRVFAVHISRIYWAYTSMLQRLYLSFRDGWSLNGLRVCWEVHTNESWFIPSPTFRRFTRRNLRQKEQVRCCTLSIEDLSYLTKHEVAHCISALSDLLVSDNNDVSTVTTGSNKPQQWLGAVGKSAS